MIGALKDKYSLPKLLKRLHLSRSSYYYQMSVMKVNEKHESLRIHIKEIFHNNHGTYGYRRIKILLKREGIVVSEKVIRRIKKEEGLIVNVRSKRRYNSYKGEISPAAANLIERNFHSDKPN